jgi:transglutaminase-like putative cysteine protease
VITGRERSVRPDVSTMIGCALTALVVIGAGVGLSGMRLTVFHVTPPKAGSSAALGSGADGADLLSGIALVDNLLAVEIQKSHSVVFTATSPVPTYWEVGTLADFTGTSWLPTAAEATALSGSPGSADAALAPSTLPAPSATQALTVRVSITDFLSRLLPTPPHALNVYGVSGARAIDDEGILAVHSATPGTRYGVSSRLEPSGPVAGPALSRSDPRVSPYLALPAEPGVVSQLAHEAVGTATTPAAQVQALVDWFRNGQFRYTLAPPATSGSNPLVQFLTVTKAGYCQQFAGAFGVLARSLGIPTRLVVGFTAGTLGANDTYTVTGADAHVWPQVYLGPASGWVSVEPTPTSPAGTDAAGVEGPTPISTGTTTVTVPTTVPVGAATSPTGGSHHTSPTSTTHHGSSIPWVIWVVAAAVLIGGVVLVRRRRSPADLDRHPDQVVVRAWERALASLRRQGLPHQRGETPDEYAARVWSAHDSPESRIRADALADLAELVGLACYTPRPTTPAQAAEAEALAATVSGPIRRQPVPV